jgi:hypothetical protein
MKKRFKGSSQSYIWACLLGLGLSGMTALAQVHPSPDKPASVVKQDEEAGRWLMTQMALLESLRQLPEQFELGLQQAQAQGMPPELAKLVLRSGREVYDLKQLEPQALALLLKSLGPEHLKAWTGFYKTPLGQKIALADIQGASAQTMGFVMENAPKIMAELAADTSRMALIQSVVDASQSVDRAVSMNMAMSLAMEWALVSAMPDQPGKPTFRQLQDHVEQQRFVMRSQMSQWVLAHAAHVHKSLSIPELHQFLAQANSPAGQALYRGFGQTFAYWINQYAQRLGQSVHQGLKKQGV